MIIFIIKAEKCDFGHHVQACSAISYIFSTTSISGMAYTSIWQNSQLQLNTIVWKLVCNINLQIPKKINVNPKQLLSDTATLSTLPAFSET